MKTNGLVVASIITMYGLTAQAFFGPDTFQEACHKGARARVEFKVVDDDGRPVHGANVNVFFDMADRSKGKRVLTRTAFAPWRKKQWEYWR